MKAGRQRQRNIYTKKDRKHAGKKQETKKERKKNVERRFEQTWSEK
jgi:hypothetical protein